MEFWHFIYYVRTNVIMSNVCLNSLHTGIGGRARMVFLKRFATVLVLRNSVCEYHIKYYKDILEICSDLYKAE